MPTVSPTEKVGKYVSPREWNALISDPDTVSISFPIWSFIFHIQIFFILQKKIINHNLIMRSYHALIISSVATYIGDANNL